MYKRSRRRVNNGAPPKVDTLVIIGNGFDIWQGIHTGYDQFEAYYYDHLDEILKKLRIKKIEVFNLDETPAVDSQGKPITLSDVEILYGDPFDPGTRLSYAFWHRFEDSLDKLDAQQLNLFFGKDASDLKSMKRSVENTRRILRQAFCDWIASIDIEDNDTGYRFGDNCVFINFNYTDTLTRRFHVDSANEYHIHGSAEDPDSIIFGHASHPEYPYTPLYKMGGRFRGLYFIEEILYTMDKHVEDNYRDLCMFLALRGVNIKDIQYIYVLGHSFGAADIGYFRHIIDATQGIAFDPEEDLTEQERDHLDGMDSLEEMEMNIQYAMHAGYRSMGVIPDTFPPIVKGDAESEAQLHLETAVVRRRFLREQAVRDAKKDKMFLKLLRREYRVHRRWPIKKHARSDGDDTVPVGEPEKHAPPQWHVSYFSKSGRERIEKTLRELKCENFTLHSSIDECLTPFKDSVNKRM